MSAAMNQKIIIMKLKHKILTLIAGTLTTFALTSCNDFLDRDPLGQFTEDDAPNALTSLPEYPPS